MVRSILSVPGNRGDMALGARRHGADLIAWDLEDSVPLALKEHALEIVRARAQPEDAVRVNTAAEARCLTVAQFNLPKVESGDQVATFRPAARGAKVLAVIESPTAVLNAREICQAADAVAFGRADFAAAAGVPLTATAMLVKHAMGQIALAALAAGIPFYDSPCETLDDLDMWLEVQQAIAFGFTGKICIHPSQLGRCAAFGRSSEDDLAGLRGSGGMMRGGRFVAEPHFKLAERLA